MEEKAEGISNRKVVQMIILSISMAGLFYGLTALAASMAVPWKEIVGLELPAAGPSKRRFIRRCWLRSSSWRALWNRDHLEHGFHIFLTRHFCPEPRADNTARFWPDSSGF